MPATTNYYEYKPVPTKHLPPIGATMMMHLFNGCAAVPQERSYFIDLLPKKKDGPLEFQKGKIDGNTGYGLHFREVLNYSLPLTALFVINIAASLIFGVCWSVLEKDLQDAWTIAAWISSIVALGVSAWLAFAAS